MEPKDFVSNKSGQIIKTAQDYWAFVPNPLPPQLPIDWDFASAISRADRALSELGGLARNLPNPHLLISPFVRKEAVLSSRIEGTQASLSDLFYYEAAREARPNSSKASLQDVHEVSNYVRALEYALKRIETLPLSLRLLREIHEILMSGARGQDKTPGEFRRSQNWIGPPGCSLPDAVFVPPPPSDMMDTLSLLEKYLHSPSVLPPVIRLACVHYQFEAIHPFLDGNGRIGRLLISLMLCTEKLLLHPLLFLSAFFDRNRDEYYRHLLEVSRQGKWREWIEFFLQGIIEQSHESSNRAIKLLSLWQTFKVKCQEVRSSSLLIKLIDKLFEYPIVSIPFAAKFLNITHRSSVNLIQKLLDEKIVIEITQRKRNKLYAAYEIINLLEEDSLQEKIFQPSLQKNEKNE